MRKLNNRGAALLSVVIAMTVVAILGALILSLSYLNLNTKMIDRQSKENSYTAESVLDDIIASLEAKMSVEYVTAYTAVMSDYGAYANGTPVSGLTMTDEMQAAFFQEFIVDMALYLAVDPVTLANYDIAKLIDNPETDAAGLVTAHHYVYDGKYPGTVSVVSTGNTMEMFQEDDPVTGKVLSAYLYLRNLKITYTENGFENTITTDLRIQAPKLTFAEIVSLANIGEYAYIAQSGITVEGNNSWAKLQGSAFSGLATTVTDNGSGQPLVTKGEGGITVSTGATFDATGAQRLISEGLTVVKGASAFLTGTNQNSSFWTRGLELSSTAGTSSSAVANNEVTLSGRTYVEDDTTLKGSGNQLAIKGEYFGFSASNTQSNESSAIIVNGRNSVLDLSQLKTLLVAGAAFVPATNAGVEGAADNADVVLGESMAVKGEQIAFMVPTECTGIVSNPMNPEQYAALRSSASWKQTALRTQIASLHSNLYKYDSELDIVPMVYTSFNETVVYLYLKFSNIAYAKAYFMDVLQKDTAMANRIQSYLNNYVQAISFNAEDMSRLVTNGNYLTQGVAVTDAEGNVHYKAAYAASETTVRDFSQELSNYRNSFASLCYNLTATTNTGGRQANVYESLIHKDRVTALAGAGGMSTFSASGITAIVADRDITLTESGSGMIICNGNVTIPAAITWDGIILCNGRLIVTGGNISGNSAVFMRASDVNVSMAQELATGNGSYPFIKNLLVGGESYAGNTLVMTPTEIAEAAKLTDIRNCLQKENYTIE